MHLRYAPLVLWLLCAPCAPEESGPAGRPLLEPYDFLFDTAVEAYYRGDWLSVILNMEKALRNKATVRSVKAHCRLGCANRTAFDSGAPVPGAGSVEDLGFFQRILKRADCVNSCEVEKLGSPTLHQVSEDVELEFRKRTPYNYLQVAYFKIEKLDKAVAAANTFFLANPNHVEMKQNLDYYRMMAGVQEADFRDLEAPAHMAEFLLGKSYYSDESFGLAAEHLEAAVREYFPADRECRALCEGAYNYDGYNYMEYSADLFQTVTDHYMQVLSCKQRCAVELASTAGRDKPFDDFLPSLFNYLQFSYYNSEKFELAIECAKTFLLFHPDDVVMTQNLNYYSVVLGEDKAAGISAREVVKQYIQQSLLEKELLYYGYEAFGIAFVDPDTWTPEDVMPKKLREKQKADRETAARITEEIGNLMKEIETLVEEKKKDSSDLAKMVVPQEGGAVLQDDIRLTLTSRQLNGSQRVLLDGVIDADQCRELQRLSNAAAEKGDGYKGRPSPHSPGELFQGVTVLKAVKLGQEGRVPLQSARLFFHLSDKVRQVMESYFQTETKLYFSYSHLVCRSAIDEKQEERSDLSHPVHVDNCLLVSEINECIKEPPAYTHRDYSAILYLNDDFEGGDFIFTELDAKTVTAEVRPQCGRVVGFGAGKENPHGVRAVTKGQRCAVALWFTLDPSHQEKERIQAEELLNMFSSPVDAEFAQNSRTDTSEPQAAESPPQTDRQPAGWPQGGGAEKKPNKDPAPSSKDPAPSSKDPAPSSKDPAPSSTDHAPSSEDPAPSSKDPAPSSKDPAPSSKDPAPSSKDPAASSKPAVKTKAAPKAKAKPKVQTKAKVAKAAKAAADKSKPAAKSDGKQGKTKSKPAGKKDSKAAAKTLQKAAAPAADAQKAREEL